MATSNYLQAVENAQAEAAENARILKELRAATARYRLALEWLIFEYEQSPPDTVLSSCINYQPFHAARRARDALRDQFDV